MVDRPARRAMARPIALLLSAFLAVPGFAQTVEDGHVAAQQGDPATAIAIWRPLAEAGNAEAQYLLAETYWGGWWGGAENLEQRAFWHMQAAEQGYAPSFVQLGQMHAFGHYFAQDDVTAADWYARAAEVGNADGLYALGHQFFQGRGVPRDLEEALRLWREAAAQGHEGARLDLCAEKPDVCNE